MKVSRLLVQDFMRVKFVEIRPTEDVVRLHGKNAQGKTSLIRALESALGGKSLHPTQPVREGAESATVEVDLDGIRVVVKWDAKTGKADLKVSAADGARYPKSQTLLDGFVGKLSFDPLAFMAMAPKEQVETLRKMVGADFAAIDNRRALAYEKRTAANRELDAAKALLDSINAPPEGTPDEPISLAELLAEQEREQAKAAAIASATARLESQVAAVERQESALAAARNRIEHLRIEYEKAKKAAENVAFDLDKARAAEAKLDTEISALPRPELEPIRAKLATVEKTNAAVKAKKAHAARLVAVSSLRNSVAVFTKAVEEADEQKAAVIRDAKLPIDGLSFDGEAVYYNRRTFLQASHAEQLRISIAMGIALNPSLRVLLVRQGALLDEDGWKLLEAAAAKHDCQVWIEDVGVDGPGFLIEDGSVAGAVPDAARVT